MSTGMKERLQEGNLRSLARGGEALRLRTSREGQHPYAIIVCCSDSRVIPEKIFDADVGDLFVIRVAGNVLDRHQLGSIAYAAGHLGCGTVIMLGHTGCGAIAATIEGHGEGLIASLTEEIQKAIGTERDPYRACVQNVRYGVDRIRAAFSDGAGGDALEVLGAIYDIESGTVAWIS